MEVLSDVQSQETSFDLKLLLNSRQLTCTEIASGSALHREVLATFCCDEYC